MISNQLGTIIVDGFAIRTAPVYQKNESTAVACSFVVADGKGSAKRAQAVYVYDDILCYFLSEVSLSDMYCYNIYGTCNTGNTMVHVTPKPEE